MRTFSQLFLRILSQCGRLQFTLPPKHTASDKHIDQRSSQVTGLPTPDVAMAADSSMYYRQ